MSGSVADCIKMNACYKMLKLKKKLKIQEQSNIHSSSVANQAACFYLQKDILILINMTVKAGTGIKLFHYFKVKPRSKQEMLRAQFIVFLFKANSLKLYGCLNKSFTG